MRKKLMILALVLLLGFGTGVAILLPDKTSALNYFRIFKDNREEQIEKAVVNIELLSDKVCTIDYYSEDVLCFVEYEVLLNGENMKNDILLSPDTTKEQDTKAIEEAARSIIEKSFPIETVVYVEREMKGDRITIIKPK